MKHVIVTLVVTMILKDTATFQVPHIFSLYCAWNITTVEINSGVHLLYLKVKLILLILILAAFLVRPLQEGHGCITSKMIKYSY